MGRGADEADRADAVVGEKRVDRLLVAVDDVEHARRQARLHQQLAKPHRHRRIAFRRLERPGITAGQRRREFPHRDHRRKVERRDAGNDAERLAHGVEVDAGPGALGVFALEQVRNAAGGFLDHFEAALHVALGVGEGLRPCSEESSRAREFELLLRQFEEFHHHARAPLRVRGRPGGLAVLATAIACSTSECLASATLAMACRGAWG